MPTKTTRSNAVPRTSSRTSLRTGTEEIPRRPFGSTGEIVSALGMGGFHLGLIGIEREATSLLHEAVDAGITFMDNAWEYHDGVSETRMGKALASGWRQRVFLMSKVCTRGRDAKVAMRQLEDSLRRLKTDYLDLWQVHEVAYAGDPERRFMLERIRARYAPHAVDGRFELYKTTAKHEADVGRKQHGFPPQAELGG